MNSVCILTDSTAQFPQLAFPGRNLVRVIYMDVMLNGVLYPEGKDLKANVLPPTASGTLNPRVLAPSQEKLRQLFSSLGQTYNEIIAIFASSSLTGMVTSAREACDSVAGRVSVQLVDSHTTSVGLGLLVQAAAEAAAQGIHASEIERIVRAMIPRIYMVLCTPGLSYLYHSGIVDRSQAAVGEMLGLLPIFAMEEGHLTPLEKLRTHRNVIEFFQEFLDEFDTLQHIALLQAVQSSAQDSRMLREHAEDLFAQTPFSEHGINLPLATLLGPRTSGLILVESAEPGPAAFTRMG